jgi:hypothetical protein
VRDDPRPRLSVIIAACGAGAAVERCLSTLSAASHRHEVEVIVADSSADGTAELVRHRFPHVRLLHFHNRLGVPHLRGRALAEARGEVIAFLDPYCLADAAWLETVTSVHRERPEPAIGGAVALDESVRPTLVNWATYLAEYAAFVPPLSEGAVEELAGGNIAYKRQALSEVISEPQDGFWKVFVNHQMQARGHRLWATPCLDVKLCKPVAFGEFARSRFHHGRCFAAMRVASTGAASREAGAGVAARALRASTVAALPALMLWRRGKALWSKRHLRLKFLAVIPLLMVFDVSWAWGELWGYLAGVGGSCRQLYY